MPTINNSAAIQIFSISKEAHDDIERRVDYKKKILDFLHNDNLFRIGDTNVSWRNAVYLEKVGLLKEKKTETGWRKLNFIDAIYFDLIVELRKFGLASKNLIPLKNAFYESENKIDSMFLAAFHGYEITMLIFNDGSGYIFDPQAYMNFELHARSRLNRARITIELNPFINKALSLRDIPKITTSKTIRDYMKGGKP